MRMHKTILYYSINRQWINPTHWRMIYESTTAWQWNVSAVLFSTTRTSRSHWRGICTVNKRHPRWKINPELRYECGGITKAGVYDSVASYLFADYLYNECHEQKTEFDRMVMVYVNEDRHSSNILKALDWLQDYNPDRLLKMWYDVRQLCPSDPKVNPTTQKVFEYLTEYKELNGTKR